MKRLFSLIILLLLNISLLYPQVPKNFKKRFSGQFKVIYYFPDDKGFIIPEYNNLQRDGLYPPSGFVIYNSSSESFEYYNRATWRKFNLHEAKLPTLSTIQVFDISPTKATSGGIITSDGGLPITSRGICWNTHTNPTLTDSITSDSIGVGNFSSHIKGLMGNTTYFARAYATNRKGTGYGNEISFKTPPFNLLCTYGVDSVTLKIEGYHNRGDVEWQASIDSIHWTTITGVLNDTYRFLLTKTQYYRALIKNSPFEAQHSIIILVKLKTLLKPEISTIAVSQLSDTGFVITAGINHISDTIPVLHYGKTTEYGLSVNGVSGVNNSYSFTVTGLDNYTIYHYKIAAGKTSCIDHYIIPASEVNTGSQVWGLKNAFLTITPMGYEIPEITDNAAWSTATIPAWCYPGLNRANLPAYGRIYNRYALLKIQEDIETYNALHPEAPFIYDVSTKADYDLLISEYGTTKIAGRHLKEGSITRWTQDMADNSSGFTAVPAGYRLQSGTTEGIGTHGLLWYLDKIAGITLRQNSEAITTLSSIIGFGNNCGASFRFIKSNRTIPKYKPDVNTIEPVNIQTTSKILYIDQADNLYGTDGYRDIIKATKLDLSDKITVCQLPSNSMIKKLKFVSSDKAVGYAQDGVSPANSGFYCFDNANTNNWAARKVGTMVAGVPPLEFQGFCNTPDFSHLWMCSYGTKDTNPAPINVYRSTDLGETWTVCYTHSVTENTHIHAIEWDSFISRLWVLIGDEGLGGKPGWAYSDDYGVTFSFVENNDATGQIPFMDTAIIPLPNSTLIGSDYTPAGIREWKPAAKINGVAVSNSDIKTLRYCTNSYATQNLGFARNPLIDLSTTPYRIAISFIFNASYSKGQLLVSPDAKTWYNVENVNDPLTQLGFEHITGITSSGYVIGWSTYTGTHYHRYFKFPNWVKNSNY